MRFDAERALAEADEFAFPRLARSPGERRGADLLVAKLTAAGLAADRRDAAPPKVPGLAILAGLVAWLWLATGRALPEATLLGRFGLLAAGIALLLSAILRLAESVRRQGLDGKAQQLLAARPGDAGAAARVVFVTRLYTINSRAILRLHWALLILVVTVGAFLMTPWAAGLIGSTRWAGPALLAAHWGGLVLMFAAPKGGPQAPWPGDNRSGLSALAELARAWPKTADRRVEVRFAATSGRGDLARIIAREWPAKPTLVVVLESPGLGDGLILDARGAARPLARSAAEALWIPPATGDAGPAPRWSGTGGRSSTRRPSRPSRETRNVHVTCSMFKNSVGSCRRRYARKIIPPDLTDRQWKRLVHLVPTPKPGGRPARYSRREVVNAVPYQAREGCTWRALPHDLPPYRIAFHDFRAGQADGTREVVHAALREAVRLAAGKNRRPTTGVVDSQAVRTTEQAGPRGVRRGKKVHGRKRHVVVDTLGLVWGLVVTPAGVQDGDGAREVILRAKLAAPRLARVFADSAYAAVVFWAVWFARLAVLLVRKNPGQKGFVVKPKRWIVERTFGWLNRYRRLSKDYERTTGSSAAFV